MDILLTQHKRGRELTDLIRDKCKTGRIAAGGAESVVGGLKTFACIYDAHAAYENTIAFQARKRSMSVLQLRQAGEQFGEIEHAAFEGNGFDIGIDRIATI